MKKDSNESVNLKDNEQLNLFVGLRETNEHNSSDENILLSRSVILQSGKQT